MTLAERVLVMAVPALLLSSSPSWAAEMQVGTALVCGTQQQVERFIALYDGDAEAAASSVNEEEHDEKACRLATLAFVAGTPLATGRSKNATFQIVPIVVIGRVTPEGIKAVEPVRFFSVAEVEEQET